MNTSFPKLIKLKAFLGFLFTFLFCGYTSFAQPGYTCGEAIPLSSGDCGVYANTGIPGTMAASCFSGLNSSMWFSFVADSVGTRIVIDGGIPHTMGKSSVALFENSGGCAGTFTELSGACDNPNSDTSSVNYSGLTIGNTYYILVDGRGAAGSFNICLETYSPPPGPPVIASELATNVSTCGGSDGTISITVTGGTGAYQYSIDGGSTFFSNGGSFSGLPAGDYPIAITDGNFTINGSILTIADPGPIAAPLAGTNATYCEGDAMLNMTVTMGSGGTATWYSDPGLTMVIGTGTTLMPSAIIGVTDYYVTETVTACESASSVVSITINPIVSSSISESICEGNTYTLGTQTLSASGTYMETFSSAAGCDSIVTLNLTVVPAITNSISASICAGDSYTLGTQTLSTPGTYSETFVAANGCDSIVTLNLNVIPVIINFISASICSGNTYTLGTQTLSASGIYNEIFVAASGCDSIVILNLNVIPVVTNSISASICSGNTYILGTQTLSTPGTYNETFVAASGCDSVVTLNLSVVSVITNTISASICSGNTYTLGTQTLNAPGTYNETFVSEGGCDSVVTLNLNVIPAITNTISSSICQGSTYTLGTQTLSASGTYNETFVSAGGCDSVVTLNLNVIPAITNTISSSICQGSTYTLGTQTLNASGTYNETFVSVGGCDSVVTLNLTVVPAITNSINANICQGNTYTLGTQILNASGTYNETFVSIGGCDSVVTLTLAVDALPIANAGADVTICKGKETTLNGSGGTNYSWLPLSQISNPGSSSPGVYPLESTTYILTVSTASGCSSTDTVNVFVKTDGDCQFHIYANFTPNNDNINDTWVMDGIEAYNTITVSIYNRWGDEVWKTENYNNTTNVWTGKSKRSEDLPDGTYFYVISADEDTYHGSVEINR